MACAAHNNHAIIRPTSSPLMEDCNSHFFLHNGDHSSLVLVSHYLTSSNYNTWIQAMLMALVVKNKIGFVDDRIPHPTTNDLLLSIRTHCSSMVISWILNVVTREIAYSLLIDTAFEIWGELRGQIH